MKKKVIINFVVGMVVLVTLVLSYIVEELYMVSEYDSAAEAMYLTLYSLNSNIMSVALLAMIAISIKFFYDEFK